MKILFGCPTFYIGGWSTYSLNLSKVLRKNGISTIAFVLEQYGSLYKEFIENFDEVVICERKLESKNNYLKRIITSINRLAPNVIINNSTPFIQASFPYLKEPIKLSTIHSIMKEEINYGTACLKHLDFVIAVAPNIYNIILPHGKEKCRLIEIGILLSEDEPQKKRSEILELVYVGRLSKEAKNLEMMERILAKLFEKEIRFNLSFIGAGDYYSVLKKKLATQPFFKNIRFYGNLSPTSVLDILKNFDIFLLTSTYEGTPHSLLEAMANKVVPVTSNIEGSTDRIIKNGVNGLLCNINNVEQFVNAICKLDRDHRFLESLGNAARQTIVSSYDLTIRVSKYLDLFAIKNSSSYIVRQEKHIKVPKELDSGCYGFFRQIRRIWGDYYRRVFFNVKRISINGN